MNTALEIIESRILQSLLQHIKVFHEILLCVRCVQTGVIDFAALQCNAVHCAAM